MYSSVKRCRLRAETAGASSLPRSVEQLTGLVGRVPLKDLVRELLGIELSKEQQSSDWGATELTPQQQSYAASDVLHLHALKSRLDAMLEREGRMDLAEACFSFLPNRAVLDLVGFDDMDIFSH